MIKKIEAILFDMDGLMFDTERIYLEGWVRAGEYFSLSEEVLQIGQASLGLSNKATVEYLAEKVGSEAYADEIFGYVTKYRNDTLHNKPVPERPGLRTLLQYIKKEGIRAAVASSSTYTVVEGLVTKAGIRDYFDVMIGGDMVTHAKPAPDIFLQAANRLQVFPDTCMVLEDSIHGIQAAYAAGTIPVMVPDLLKPTAEIAHMLYAVVADLYAVIELIVNHGAIVV